MLQPRPNPHFWCPAPAQSARHAVRQRRGTSPAHLPFSMFQNITLTPSTMVCYCLRTILLLLAGILRMSVCVAGAGCTETRPETWSAAVPSPPSRSESVTSLRSLTRSGGSACLRNELGLPRRTQPCQSVRTVIQRNRHENALYSERLSSSWTLSHVRINLSVLEIS